MFPKKFSSPFKWINFYLVRQFVLGKLNFLSQLVESRLTLFFYGPEIRLLFDIRHFVYVRFMHNFDSNSCRFMLRIHSYPINCTNTECILVSSYGNVDLFWIAVFIHGRCPTFRSLFRTKIYKLELSRKSTGCRLEGDRF